MNLKRGDNLRKCELLTNLDFLQEGKPFPPVSQRERLLTYEQNKMLFEDQHSEVYKEQFSRIERVIGNFEQIVSYSTIFNFQKLMTLKIADFVFGAKPKVTVSDDTKQEIINKIVHRTDLYNKLYMSAIDISRYGNSVMQLFKSQSDVGLNVTSPALWFPVVSHDNIQEFLCHCFCWTYIISSTEHYTKYGLKVHIHYPSEPKWCYVLDFELNGSNGNFTIGKRLNKDEKLEIEADLKKCPIFVVANTLTSDRCFGIDDYGSIDSIVSELEIRVSQVSKILDKFSNPSMSGPRSCMTYNDQTQRYEFKVGEYYEINDGAPRPEMITWDAGLDANFKQIEFLVNQLHTISEMGSAVFGDLSNSAGNVASGTALRRLMISPLAKAKRIVNVYDSVLKNMISLAAEIYGVHIEPEEISIAWRDGLPNDPREDAEIMNIRTGGKATMSRRTAIAKYDEKSDEDVDNEIAQIEADEISDTFGNVPVNEPESVVVDE